MMQHKQLATGFKHYRRDDGIFAVEFTDMRRATIEEWIGNFRANCQLGVDHKVHILHLYTLRSIAVTPFAIQTVAREVTALPPPPILHQSVGLFIADRVVAMLVSAAIHQFTTFARSSTSIFKTEAEAVAWLHQRGESIMAMDGTPPTPLTLNPVYATPQLEAE